MAKRDWLEIPFSASYEINRDGVIRNIKTRKIRSSQAPLAYRGVDGKRKVMTKWHVMELVWPEVVS